MQLGPFSLIPANMKARNNGRPDARTTGVYTLYSQTQQTEEEEEEEEDDDDDDDGNVQLGTRLLPNCPFPHSLQMR